MNVHAAYFTASDCDLSAFEALIASTLDPADVPHAGEVTRNIPVYDIKALAPALADSTARQALMGEWATVLMHLSGVIVLKGAYADTSAIDRATAVYEEIIADEKNNATGGDHFATAGANDRVWNSLQKLCLKDPASFAAYFGNDAIAAASEAWLGPGYQMTAQVNLVRPGGRAQRVHRDYHLGFQTNDVALRFPAHAHDLSPVMTLQGAIAHCDMPIESGPTKLLPFSQLFRPGYLAYRDEAFAQCFEENFVQMPLEKGDAVFFNPALFHAAGDNNSKDIQRLVNLLQVSSAFGRALEAVNRDAMCRVLYPVLRGANTLTDVQRRAAIAACAEGYPFPTSLDTDPPIGGLAPETRAALFQRALDEGFNAETFNAALDALAARRQP